MESLATPGTREERGTDCSGVGSERGFVFWIAAPEGISLETTADWALACSSVRVGVDRPVSLRINSEARAQGKGNGTMTQTKKAIAMNTVALFKKSHLAFIRLLPVISFPKKVSVTYRPLLRAVTAYAMQNVLSSFS
jgi:hypothetical protein